MSREHRYELQMVWTGNSGEGTRSYRGYRRDHVFRVPGKPDLPGSSDPAFHGDRHRYNPEELLVASLSACHMLWYLHLCADNNVIVIVYEDAPRGIMELADDGSGAFTSVELRPTVTISAGSDVVQAKELHHQAHRNCFIANSMNFPVKVSPTITLASGEGDVARNGV